MKEVIKIFDNKKVRIFIKNNEPFFSITDICKVFDLTNVTDTLKTLDPDDIDSIDVIDSLKRMQSIYIINESALYDVIFRSKKKEAKLFKKWVTHEVLPSIRKTGKYNIPEKLKEISTKNRNGLTAEWKAHGVEKQYHYINLTKQEYKNLQIEKKSKKDFNDKELMLLTAYELMEALKLYNNPEIEGYNECKESLIETGKNLLGSIKPKEIK